MSSYDGEVSLSFSAGLSFSHSDSQVEDQEIPVVLELKAEEVPIIQEKKEEVVASPSFDTHSIVLGSEERIRLRREKALQREAEKKRRNEQWQKNVEEKRKSDMEIFGSCVPIDRSKLKSRLVATIRAGYSKPVSTGSDNKRMSSTFESAFPALVQSQMAALQSIEENNSGNDSSENYSDDDDHEETIKDPKETEETHLEWKKEIEINDNDSKSKKEEDSDKSNSKSSDTKTEDTENNDNKNVDGEGNEENVAVFHKRKSKVLKSAMKKLVVVLTPAEKRRARLKEMKELREKRKAEREAKVQEERERWQREQEAEKAKRLEDEKQYKLEQERMYALIQKKQEEERKWKEEKIKFIKQRKEAMDPNRKIDRRKLVLQARRHMRQSSRTVGSQEIDDIDEIEEEEKERPLPKVRSLTSRSSMKQKKMFRKFHGLQLPTVKSKKKASAKTSRRARSMNAIDKQQLNPAVLYTQEWETNLRSFPSEYELAHPWDPYKRFYFPVELHTPRSSKKKDDTTHTNKSIENKGDMDWDALLTRPFDIEEVLSTPKMILPSKCAASPYKMMPIAPASPSPNKRRQLRRRSKANNAKEEDNKKEDSDVKNDENIEKTEEVAGKEEAEVKEEEKSKIDSETNSNGNRKVSIDNETANEVKEENVDNKSKNDDNNNNMNM